MKPLYPYQLSGAYGLAGRRYALLADDPGLGKSAISITGSCMMLESAERAARILVICPAVACENWLNEFRMWKGAFQRLPQTRRKMFLGIGPQESAIVSYEWAVENAELLTAAGPYCYWAPGRSYYETRVTARFDLIIIDESHYLSALDSQRSTKILGANGIIRMADRVWFLSGTPMRNNPANLWTLCRVVGATQMSYAAWVQKFCLYKWTGRGYMIYGSNEAALPELNQILNKFMIRRRREEVGIQLPPIRFGTVTLEPPPGDPEGFNPAEHEKMQLELDLLRHAAGEPNNHWGDDKLQLLMGLAKSTQTIFRYVGLQKVPGVVEMIRQDLESNPTRKAFVVFAHRGVGEALAKQLSSFDPRLVYGGMNYQRRNKYISEFQIGLKVRIIIGQIQAIGISVNLTAADIVWVVETTFSPTDLAQAILRAHRIGRTESVDVRFVQLISSMDQAVMNLMRRKARDIALAVDGVRKAMFSETADTEKPMAKEEDLL